MREYIIPKVKIDKAYYDAAKKTKDKSLFHFLVDSVDYKYLEELFNVYVYDPFDETIQKEIDDGTITLSKYNMVIEERKDNRYTLLLEGKLLDKDD